MKKYNSLSIALFFFLFLPFILQAQKEKKILTESDYEQMAEEEAQANRVDGESMLWEVSGNGAVPFHIFGTIHMMDEEFFTMSEKLKETVREAELMVMELDMDAPDLQDQMAKLVIMENTTLDKLLSAADYKIATTYFQKELGADLKLFNNIKPFAVMAMLYPKMIDNAPKSYEKELVQLAKENDKEIEGLETVAFQMSVFDEIPLKEQAAMLMTAIKDMKKQKQLFTQMTNLYLAGNPQTLFDFIIENMEEYKKYQNSFLDARNEAWMEQIRNYTTEQRAFIAVGAGHLSGENGLLMRLKREGYELKAVDNF